MKNVFLTMLLFLSATRSMAMVNDDSKLVAAVEARQQVNFIEAGNMVVTSILPDDTQGRPHQKWLVRLSDNRQVQMVYNTDMGDRVQLQEGDVIAAGGQLVMDYQGRPVLHWLHADPRHNRPDGYVYAEGHLYGEVH